MHRNVATIVLVLGTTAAALAAPSIVSSEFIYEHAPFPQCHASTIIEVNGDLLAAWFGGSRESATDVCIWLARKPAAGAGWSAPVQVADGIDGAKRYPTWNPVLFQPRGGPLMLFYKVGPKPDRWWGMVLTSTNAGATWSKPARLAAGILGPIKDKPVQLASGAIIAGSSTEHDSWRVHFERSLDGGVTWRSTVNVDDPEKFGAIQPTILVHANGDLQALCRSRKGKIVETWSRDAGATWSPLAATALPNPNAGIDAVTLRDGRHLVVYNHTTKGRTPLNVAIAAPDGRSWEPPIALETEAGEYSYPAVIQAHDGTVHITYTWKRQRIKHAVLRP